MEVKLVTTSEDLTKKPAAIATLWKQIWEVEQIWAKDNSLRIAGEEGFLKAITSDEELIHVLSIMMEVIKCSELDKHYYDPLVRTLYWVARLAPAAHAKLLGTEYKIATKDLLLTPDLELLHFRLLILSLILENNQANVLAPLLEGAALLTTILGVLPSILFVKKPNPRLFGTWLHCFCYLEPLLQVQSKGAKQPVEHLSIVLQQLDLFLQHERTTAEHKDVVNNFGDLLIETFRLELSGRIKAEDSKNDEVEYVGGLKYGQVPVHEYHYLLRQKSILTFFSAYFYQIQEKKLAQVLFYPKKINSIVEIISDVVIKASTSSILKQYIEEGGAEDAKHWEQEEVIWFLSDCFNIGAAILDASLQYQIQRAEWWIELVTAFQRLPVWVKKGAHLKPLIHVFVEKKMVLADEKVLDGAVGAVKPHTVASGPAAAFRMWTAADGRQTQLRYVESAVHSVLVDDATKVDKKSSSVSLANREGDSFNLKFEDLSEEDQVWVLLAGAPAEPVARLDENKETLDYSQFFRTWSFIGGLKSELALINIVEDRITFVRKDDIEVVVTTPWLEESESKALQEVQEELKGLIKLIGIDEKLLEGPITKESGQVITFKELQSIENAIKSDVNVVAWQLLLSKNNFALIQLLSYRLQSVEVGALLEGISSAKLVAVERQQSKRARQDSDLYKGSGPKGYYNEMTTGGVYKWDEEEAPEPEQQDTTVYSLMHVLHLLSSLLPISCAAKITKSGGTETLLNLVTHISDKKHVEETLKQTSVLGFSKVLELCNSVLMYCPTLALRFTSLPSAYIQAWLPLLAHPSGEVLSHVTQLFLFFNYVSSFFTAELLSPVMGGARLPPAPAEPSPSALYNAVQGHPHASELSSRIIVLANQPDDQRLLKVSLYFITQIFLYEESKNVGKAGSQVASFFYTNDILVFIEVLVRLVNDSKPGDITILTILTCLGAVLSWPDYANHMHKPKIILQALQGLLQTTVDQATKLGVGLKASVSALSSDPGDLLPVTYQTARTVAFSFVTRDCKPH